MEKTKYSILIVDDQESSIAVLTKILNPEYIIYAATTGQDGIQSAEKYLPDIILLDVLMFDMDGYAVISELKKSERTKNIPVIFISSLNKTEDEEKGLTLGAADYIIKPFSPAIVKLRIQSQVRVLDYLRRAEKFGMHDELTEMPNRRCFETRLNAEWGRSMREQIPLSILVIDLDEFKNYNETYGHRQGDAALKAFADVFPQTLKRRSDFAARWNGGEFIVLLPNTDSSGALIVAEQIRKYTENMEIPVAGKPTSKITVSIGVSTWDKEYNSKNSYNKFILGAEKALYEAKNRGFNKVCSFSDT